MEIRGERIRLRSFARSDAADVFAYASDPDVSRYLDWLPHRSLLESERFVDHCLRQPPAVLLPFAVEDMASAHVVGSFEIRVVDAIRRIGEIGYALARPYWGRGYNLEAGRLLLDHAFAELHMLRVQAVCDVENRRSYRTMEKLGMVRERVLPRYRRRSGTYVDSYLYGLLWREWANLCSAAQVPAGADRRGAPPQRT